MLKFVLNSGKKVEVTLADTETALTLHQAILQQCKGAGLDLRVNAEETITDLILKNREVLLNIFSSKQIVECIKDCCSKVVYDGKRFCMDIFEDIKAKGDFYPLMLLIAIENIRPFFPQAHTMCDIMELNLLKK